MAGTFGELRSNHFHSGIDIKTKGKEGFPVIAIEDGYVSRVKVRQVVTDERFILLHYNGYGFCVCPFKRFPFRHCKRF